MDELVERLCDAAAVVSKNGITKSRAKYAELYREAARAINALQHDVERSLANHVADLNAVPQEAPQK